MHKEMEIQLKGYGLTTAEILYRMPDHPVLLQTMSGSITISPPSFPK